MLADGEPAWLVAWRERDHQPYSANAGSLSGFALTFISEGQDYLKIRSIIQRWSKREEIALKHQFHGKTMSDRFRGLRRSERNEAKLFLLALGPAILTSPFIGKWSDASLWGKSIMLITGLWMIGILIVGGFLLSRAIVRASRKRPD